MISSLFSGSNQLGRVPAPIYHYVLIGLVHLLKLLMRFKLPFNNRVHVRLFEKVETVDDSYRIVDTGLEYNDGSIDSIAVGGNFSSLSSWCGVDEKDEEYVSEDAAPIV